LGAETRGEEDAKTIFPKEKGENRKKTRQFLKKIKILNALLRRAV